VAENATVPILETGFGVCHTYVHAAADLDKAADIVFNAKTRRVSICNALDSLLVDREVADRFLPRVAARLVEAGVEIRATEDATSAIGDAAATTPAADEDLDTEFLSLRMAVSLVDGLDAALAHIERHGSGHSEAIITEEQAVARRFLNEVDAGAVFLNASTQFTDGGEFGLGAEIGISTQKLHARGPMGIREMTTYKWVIIGDGHTRS
jgi:glutamate-5-semialdehyde dehydrogenase